MSSIQLFFMRKVIRRNGADMTSRFVQLEKVGPGLLQEAFRGEGECYVSLQRGGQIIANFQVTLLG